MIKLWIMKIKSIIKLHDDILMKISSNHLDTQNERQYFFLINFFVAIRMSDVRGDQRVVIYMFCNCLCNNVTKFIYAKF